MVKKILILIGIVLLLYIPALAQFTSYSAYPDTIKVDTTGTSAWGFIYPAFLKKGANITFNLRTDTLMINATGTISGVTAGAGLTGGGTSGSVTLTIGGGNGIQVNADDIAATLGTEIDSSEIRNGTILKADVDTLNSNWTFLKVFKKTGNVADSELATYGSTLHHGTEFFTFADEPSITEGTDDSIYVQYPMASGNYDHVWLHYNTSSLADQMDSLIFVTRVPMWFLGWDSITYNYKTNTTDTTASYIQATIFKRTVDGGSATTLFTGAHLKSATANLWTHVTLSAVALTGRDWFRIRFAVRADANDSVWHDKPYVWGRR